MSEHIRQISDVVEQPRSRLRTLIRRRASNPSDVENVLQDVFFAGAEAAYARRLLLDHSNPKESIREDIADRDFGWFNLRKVRISGCSEALVATG